MATNYPTSLDVFSNPGTTSALNSPSHAGQHSNINDAVEAVQAKLGTTPSAGAHVIGELVSFTPTFEGLTVGNATVTANYAIVNDLVYYQCKLEFGSTTSVTGSVYINPPFTMNDTWLGAIGGQVQFDDNSGTDYFGMLYRSSGTRCLLSALRADSTYAKTQGMTASIPFTWTTSDKITIEDWFVPA
jgi:hypothetical protein